MNKRFFTIAGILLVLISCGALMPFDNNDKTAVLSEIIKLSLKNYHYEPQKLNDEFSKEAFNLYIDRLDYSKKFLTKADLKTLSKYETKIDDELNSNELALYLKAKGLIESRTSEVQAYYQEILASPFDFSKKETIETDPEKLEFAANEKALKERWRKYLKYQTLSKYSALIEEQEEKVKANPDSTFELKTNEELEIEAREKVLKNHDQWFKRLSKLNDQDRLSTYVNAITSVYDPHTNYFPPKDKENFDIQMSGKLEGIGATLQEKDGYIKVIKIVPGSASWRQGELKAGFTILKVGQGAEEPVDIVDMRLDDAVKLIRGPKGTEVRLTVKTIKGTVKVISIIRDVVILEETYAKSIIVYDSLSTEKFGYVYLPKFYRDFNDENGRKCSEDVKVEIEKLKNAGINGLIIDLRDNGGGSLQDVVEMGGLFIDQGPIVQVKPRDEKPYILEDPDPEIHYTGNLVIMVNELSASASEILAAAMQDYDRAVILGSEHTYGKGTVQRFVDLDYFLSGNFDHYKPLGSMKLTIQKFYRVNGGATQIKGVESDIIIPDNYKYINVGEKELEHAMPWDQIPAADYNKASGYLENLDYVKAESKKRVAADSIFRLIDEKAQIIQEMRDMSEYSLNYEAFNQLLDEQETKSDKYDNIMHPIAGLNFQVTEEDMLKIESDTTKQARMDDWQKTLKQDPYVFEAIQILEDLNKK